jgi:hypothetical protein
MQIGSVQRLISNRAILVMAVLLLLVTVCLYRKNRSYMEQNRQLILQNDSIISVNIELLRSLQPLHAAQISKQLKTVKGSIQ